MRVKDIKPQENGAILITLKCPYCGNVELVKDVTKVLEIDKVICKRCGKSNEDSGLKTV